MGESADLATTPAGAHHHVPVLLDEVLDALAIRPGGRYLDATVGGGGHAAAILKSSTPDGLLLGMDRDPEAVVRAAQRLAPYGERARVVHAAYIRLEDATAEAEMLPLDGVLFDLGFSSWQVGDPERGFSFRWDAPLDMRFDPTEATPTAADLLNTLEEAALAELLYRYGEEPRSRRIARAIVAARPVVSTGQLVELIEGTVGRPRRGVHPATLTFQALRIAVNRELELLEMALPRAVAALRPGGRLAVITFHSLEDRIVKHFFKEESRGCICPPEIPVCRCDHEPTVQLLSRKPVTPSPEEVAANPRSRSAKLRIGEKVRPSR